MGCRTGFYLLLAGDYSSKDIVSLVIEMYEFIRDFKGEVPVHLRKTAETIWI